MSTKEAKETTVMDTIIKNFNKQTINDSVENLTISEYINTIMNSDLNQEQDDEDSVYPEPSPLRISTLTGTCQITSDINLLVLSQYLNLNKYITYINYGDIVSKGVNITPKSAKKKKNKRVFYNQITIIIKHENTNRYNNIKLFANGAVSMTGLQSLEEGQKAINIILDSIRALKGKILYSITDNYYNNNIKKDSVEDVKLKCEACNKELTYYAMKLSESCGHYICNACSKDHDKCPKCDETFILPALKNEDAQLKDMNIVLINSDYKANFRINQKKLHPLIVDKYKVFSTFEPTIYPGVKSMYYWNEDYKSYPIKGKCYCTKNCTGKGTGKGDGQCKKVTTAVFQSGSVLITGGRSMEQIKDGYDFINNILKNEFNHIRKRKAKFVDEEDTEEKIVQKQSNNNKIKIHKSNIIDYPSPDMMAILVQKKIIPAII